MIPTSSASTGGATNGSASPWDADRDGRGPPPARLIRRCRNGSSCLHGRAGLAGSAAATYIRAPADRAVLERFYRTTKPFGLWGPLKRILGAEEAAAMARSTSNDLISVPFALFWQIAC